MLMATVFPSKSTGRFVAERVCAFMQELGIDQLDVVAKSDQEPSIKKLVESVGRHRAEGAGRWITEFSPVGKSASNGVIERGFNPSRAMSGYCSMRLKHFGRELSVQTNASWHGWWSGQHTH